MVKVICKRTSPLSLIMSTWWFPYAKSRSCGRSQWFHPAEQRGGTTVHPSAQYVAEAHIYELFSNYVGVSKHTSIDNKPSYLKMKYWYCVNTTLHYVIISCIRWIASWIIFKSPLAKAYGGKATWCRLPPATKQKSQSSINVLMLLYSLDYRLSVHLPSLVF